MGSSLILIAAALMGQTNKFDLAQWVDKVVTSTEHREAHRSLKELIGAPDRGFSSGQGNFHVWRHEGAYVVLQEHQLFMTPGDSRITVATLDSAGRKVVASAHVIAGYRMSIEGVQRVKRPDLSDLVFRVDMGGYSGEVAKEYYAMDGHRLALICLLDDKRNLVRNNYGAPNHTIGPEPPTYDKTAILNTLSDGTLAQKLEALTWMGGAHLEPSDQLNPIYHEPMRTVLRFWKLHQDPDVKLAIARLTSSADPWVSAMAKKFAADWKPLPKSPKKAQRITQSLKIEDVVIGDGTEFSGKEIVQSTGDRAVIVFEGRLPDGTVFETNYTSDYSPISIEAGGDSVIEGLSKGILGMRAGGTRKLTIPAELAFGPVGAGLIPPNGDVIYTVKLVHIHRGDYFGPPITRDVRAGRGPKAEVGSRVVYKWKAWLVTGKSITSKMDNPATLDLVSEPYPSDIQKVLVGMQPGGIRRTLIREFHPFEHAWFGFDMVIMEIEVLSVVEGP